MPGQGPWSPWSVYERAKPYRNCNLQPVTCNCLRRSPFGCGSIALCLFLWLLTSTTGSAGVRVFIRNSNNLAVVAYECTAGETVRAFALNVSVDRGSLLAISDFARGPSTASSPGYGIFPAAVRDRLLPVSGGFLDWTVSTYTPLAVPADAPGDTLPGLGSSGVTLEFGALWDPTDPAAVPGTNGILCSLSLSQPANVSVSPNVSRGGVVGAFVGDVLNPTFTGAPVGPMIASTSFQNGTITVNFTGGELQSAPSPGGPWADTDETSGTYTDAITPDEPRFYRVRGL
jgi:hypothetical protein